MKPTKENFGALFKYIKVGNLLEGISKVPVSLKSILGLYFLVSALSGTHWLSCDFTMVSLE